MLWDLKKLYVSLNLRRYSDGSELQEVAKGKRPCLHMMTIFSVTIASVGSVLCVRGEASTVPWKMLGVKLMFVLFHKKIPEF